MNLSKFDYLDLSSPSTGAYAKDFSESGSTASNLTPFGISTISYSSAANTYTLAAPITNVEKVIILNSTKVPDSTAINTRIYTGSTAITIMSDSTTYVENLYINVQPPFASIRLLGLSTSQWGVLSKHGAVQLSTANTYTT
jgi:hypothetical protein